MKPPRTAAWLLARLLSGDRYDAVAGDLEELFDRRVAASGAGAARRWYWRQIAHVARNHFARHSQSATTVQGDSMLKSIRDDVAYSVRGLVRQPLFTLVTVLTLALGIGANATVFSWVNAVIANPLPGTVRSSELLEFAFDRTGGRSRSVSFAEYQDLLREVPAFDGLAARDDLAVGLTSGHGTTRAWAEAASGNYFDVLGVRPFIGRGLAPADDRPGAPLVAVLGEPVWRALFGADPSVVGTTIRINEHPATIVGVAPAAFQGGEAGLRYDLWVPLSIYRVLDGARSRIDQRGFRWLALRGRLAPGVSIAEANAQVDAVASAWRRAYPGGDEYDAEVYPLPWSDDGAMGVLRTTLFVLAAVAAMVLLIACANLANLLLARATARRREMAIRRSLGATRLRLVRQMLVEAFMLASAGAAGAAVALPWTAAMLNLLAPPSELPVSLEVAIDGTVVWFTATISMLTVLLFAVAPAIHASATDVQQTLRDGGAVVGGRRTLRNALVVAQIALSLVLLVAAGLCIRSVRAANRIDVGFDVDRGIVAWLDPRAAGYDGERLAAYYDEVVHRVTALPGVENASVARRVPLGFQGTGSTSVEVEGYQPAPDERVILGFNVVGARYCATMGIGVVAGRDLEAADTPGSMRVVLISESAARRYFAGRNPLGGRIRFGPDWATVVGVVRDVRQRSLTERTRPFMYLSASQYPAGTMALHVRTATSPASLDSSVRAAVASVNPVVPVFNVASLAAHVSAATFQQRLAANLLTVFGGLALVLASVGAYAVLAWMVGQRRKEIGLRLAIGATRGAAFRLIFANGTRLIAIGMVLGLILSAAASKALGSLLVGTSVFDPLTYSVVIGVLATVGVIACAVPARRAAVVDPARTLREQ